MNPYQLAVQNSPDPYLYFSSMGQVLDVNPALCRLLGYGHEELLTLDFQTLCTQASEWLTACQDERVSLILKACDGRLVACEATLVRDSESGLHLFLQCRPERFAPNQAGELLTRLSHELRTPLHAVLGFAQLLERELADPGQQAQLSALLDNARGLLNVLDGLLAEASNAQNPSGWVAGLNLEAEPSSVTEPDWSLPLAPELRAELRQLLMPDWQQVASSRSFDRILRFAHQVEVLAHQLNAGRLLQYARELEHNCEMFNPQALTHLLRQFPSLFEEPRSLSHDPR